MALRSPVTARPASLGVVCFPPSVIPRARQAFFGSHKQNLQAKRFAGVCMVSSKIAILGVLDAQESEWASEEARWLREEKRWLREEERWLREDARWYAERKALVEHSASLQEEIKVLKQEIAYLQGQMNDEKLKDGDISELIVSLTTVLQSLNTASALGTDSSKFKANLSAVSLATNVTGTRSEISSQLPVANPRVEIPLERVTMSQGSTEVGSSGMTDGPLKESISISNRSAANRTSLKRGAEGDEVKSMQEALAKLGFYSGEEDMEYSIFSSGTERAIRSWQASLGTSEDGIVTTELLMKLFGQEIESPSAHKKTGSTSNRGNPPEGRTVGPAKASAATSNVKVQGDVTSQEKARGITNDVKSQGSTSSSAKAQSSGSTGSSVLRPSPEMQKNTYNGVEVNQNRVYLLGENRWEDPSRLVSKNGPSPAAVAIGQKCFSCKGQGTTMCTECEGTGELNVEEQFLEWAEEGAKCPYCEGEGVISCDVCDGKGLHIPS